MTEAPNDPEDAALKAIYQSLNGGHFLGTTPTAAIVAISILTSLPIESKRQAIDTMIDLFEATVFEKYLVEPLKAWRESL